MKTKLLFIALAIICVVSLSAIPQSKPQQWEYKTEQKCFDEKKINAFGDEGWELVSFAENNTGAWHCIFKRPKL